MIAGNSLCGEVTRSRASARRLHLSRNVIGSVHLTGGGSKQIDYERLLTCGSHSATERRSTIPTLGPYLVIHGLDGILRDITGGYSH